MTTPVTNMPNQDMIFCPKHPKNEATLRCIRCERPMCLDCLVRTPTGYMCKECSRQHDVKFFHGSTRDMLIHGAVCFVGMAIATLILQQVQFLSQWIFVVFLGPALGGGVAEIALRLTERRRGLYSHLIGAVTTGIGGLLGGILEAYFFYQRYLDGGLSANMPRQSDMVRLMQATQISDSAIVYALNQVFLNPVFLIFVALAVSGAYARFKVRI